MSNIDITNNDLGSVIIQRGAFLDGTIAFGGADVLAPGTILARVISNGKYQIYVKGGSTDGDGVPVGVLTYELEATGAGDLPARPMRNGEVDKDRLVIDADGDAANVDASVIDLLQQVGLIATTVEQLAQLDNQP